jgi:hypothetical protein
MAFFGQSCSLPFSFRSLDIPALFEILAESLTIVWDILQKQGVDIMNRTVQGIKRTISVIGRSRICAGLLEEGGFQ